MSEVAIALEVEDNPLNDKHVVSLFGVAAEHEAFGVIEIALVELALWDLHNNRDALYTLLKSESDAAVSKTHRAALSAYRRLREDGHEVNPALIRKYLSRVQKEASGPRTVTIAEYARKDGTIVPEHERTLPEGFTLRSAKELADITDEVMEAANSEHKKGDPAWDKKIRDAIKTVVIDAPRELRESSTGKDNVENVIREIESSENNQRFYNLNQTLFHDGEVKQAGINIAKATSWGDRFAAATDLFIAKTEHHTSTFKFAAKAIKEYGPLAGVRMANVYRRYGGYDVEMRAVGDSIVTEMGDVLPEVVSQTESREWAVKTLKGRLAGEKAYKSGSEPPSEGFIIDGDGNILAHGVGRGSDHFLPFNTQHIKKMWTNDRVEYVRSRMVGGPTQEDLHAAMMLGADRLTVVSNSGEFSLDLTQRSHGIKLEHMQVLMRYQEILDQFQSANKINGKNKSAGHLTGEGYMQALEAISNEFPLHLNFNPENNSRGLWYESHDYVQPRSRFVDELRKLFGVDNKNAKDSYGRPIDPRTRSAGIRAPGTSRVDQVLQGERWSTAFRNYEIELNQAGIPRGTPEYYQRAITRLTEYRDAFSPNSQARRAIDQKIDTLMSEAEARTGGVQQTPGTRQTWQADAVRDEMREELADKPPGYVAERRVDPDPDAGGPSDKQTAWLNETSKRYQRAMKAIEARYRSDTPDPDRLSDATFTLDLVEQALRNKKPEISAEDHLNTVLDYYQDSLDDLFRIK